ncbi:hypothetical protein ACFKHW_37700 [Bradyrhizobium lupini]|uniref:hypothetical protein n=1 Tax=Rhizobium lupini TaxID=136996 RepID=UPI00367170EB
MEDTKGRRSPSGVLVADDFRHNLIIDRYDPIFADMRASKVKHLRSANSEDAVTWNVFRSLRQITPQLWLPSLWQEAFSLGCPCDLKATVRLWQSVPPPLGLLDGGDEGHSEIDVIIETPTWVWFIEAKYRSDISLGTTTRPQRDQILRNLDVGSYHAGVRDFFFSLLIASKAASPKGADKVAQYADISVPRDRLRAHRPDGLQNLRAAGLLTWAALAKVLDEAAKVARQDDERAYAQRASVWLRERGLHQSSAMEEGKRGAHI